MDWLPKTCAYRLVHVKQDLYWWHHLVSGDHETVHEAGISARGKVIPEDQVLDRQSLPKVRMPIGDDYARLPEWKHGTPRLPGYPY